MHRSSKKSIDPDSSRLVILKILLLYIVILCCVSLCFPDNSYSLLPAEENASRNKKSVQTLPENPREISEWSEYVRDIWFYDRKMKKVVPQPDYNWIVVKFADRDRYKTRDELPGKIEQLNSNLKEHIIHYVYDPSISEDMVAYRTTESNLSQVLDKTRENRKIEYIHPALKINGKLYGTLNKAEIKWKTSMSQESRRRLLNSVHAKDFKHSLQKQSEQIEIDSSRIPVWQAANLLAEDVHVAYARPLLFELEKPITCNLQIDQPSGNIGTPISFNLKIDFLERIKINPGSIVNIDFTPRNISGDLIEINLDKPLSTINVNQSPVNIRGKIYIYTTGEYEIPKIPVAYKYKENDKFKVRNIYTEKTTLKIGSLVPDKQGKYSLDTARKNIDAAVSSLSSRDQNAGFYLLLSLVCLVLAAIGIFYLFYLLKRNKEPATEEEPATQTVLYNYLLDWCNKNKDEFDINDIKDLSRTLRKYIIHAYTIPSSLSGGGSERFIQNASEYLSVDLQNTLFDIESNLEDIVARNQIDRGKLDNILEYLNNFLEQEQEQIT